MHYPIFCVKFLDIVPQLIINHNDAEKGLIFWATLRPAIKVPPQIAIVKTNFR